MIGVIGARGRIGTHVVSGLAAGGADAVALVRGSASTSGPLPEVRADLRDRDALATAFDGIRRIFLLTPHGPDQDLLEANAVAAAREAGVEGVVKLSGTPATLGPNGPTCTAVTHWRSERLIEDAGFEFTHLRPSFLMQNLLGMLAPVMRERGRAISPLADEPIAMTDARDVARAAVELLLGPSLSGRALSVTGPRPVTFREIARLLGHRLIRIPGSLTPKAVRASSESAWEADHALRMLAFYRTGADGYVTGDFKSVTGWEPRPIEAFLEENQAEFRNTNRKGTA